MKMKKIIFRLFFYYYMTEQPLKIEEGIEDPNYLPNNLQTKESKNQNPKIGRPAKTNQEE